MRTTFDEFLLFVQMRRAKTRSIRMICHRNFVQKEPFESNCYIANHHLYQWTLLLVYSKINDCIYHAHELCRMKCALQVLHTSAWHSTA